ncbi:hypothetical protein PK35_08135 [Tamlana nanhaiensis]|uniref:Uncharacterized protein n=2 Tax=Neotamlana nanhaiensis TaxID=1382798 RepID=A0A0D7W1D6_9FLAO|nr:hypothetical protein PK35_08135 [Tamlana nanhaiensis]
MSLSKLENICNKENWEDVNQILISNGWEYYESSKGDSDRYNTITWSFNKSKYNDKASGWFYLYTYEGFPNKVGYSVFNTTEYTSIQSTLRSKGYKLKNNEIRDDELISNYSNKKFLLTISTEKRKKDEYSSLEKSFTAYHFDLIKKSGIYDPNNGFKTFYFEDSDQIETQYNIVDGKIEGVAKEFNRNGTLKTVTPYINDKRHGEEVNYLYDNETGNVNVKLITSYVNGAIEGYTKIIFLDNKNKEHILSKVYYENNLRQGPAQEIASDSLIFSNYRDDKLNGSYKIYRDLNKLLLGGIIKTDSTKLLLTDSGSYEDNLKTGFWKHYSLSGALSEGNYKKDLKSGLWKFYHPKFLNGDIEASYSQELFLTENYSNGMRNGEVEYFSQINYTTYKCEEHDNRSKSKDSCSKREYKKIHLLANYMNNELHGAYVMHDSLGILRYKGKYNKGKEDGEWIESYTIETVKAPMYVFRKGNYENGVKQGKWIEYVNEDLPLLEMNYVNNSLNGNYISYNLNGTKKYIKKFIKGNLESVKVFDSLGTKINKEYEVLKETYSNYSVRYTINLENGGKKQVDYYVYKPQKEISHFDFIDLFNQQLQEVGKSYKNGIFLTFFPDGSLETKGNMFKGEKTGKWENNYPKQNVKVITNYKSRKGLILSEFYYNLQTNKFFSGDFIYRNNKTGDYQIRRIKNGYRNGFTTYFNRDGLKLKKEKYKDGVLKE